MITLLRTFLGVCLAVPILAFANDPKCNPSSYDELIKCAEAGSTSIQISEQQLKSATKLEDAASQWINPDLEADTVQKGKKSETTAALLFTLRLGGKKSALIEEAKSEVQRAQADRDLNVNQTRLRLMMAVYRLSHLKKEISLEEESGSTFNKIVSQFQKRPALSPEQSVSLSVFRMALSDHQLRLSNLKAEEDKLIQALVASTGIQKELILKNLPQRKQAWPQLESSNNSSGSPQMRQALADLKLARSQKAKADSDAWPDIKVGPSVRNTKENGVNDTFVGVGLSMPIPVFTLNGGNKAYRAQKVIEAELAAAQSEKSLAASRNSMINRYNQLIGILKNSLSMKALDENHEQVERQFFKGLVSSPLVIEAHRQLFELEERRNSSELDAIETLGELLIMDNKFSEVIL